MSPEKIDKLKNILLSVQGRNKCSKRELLSLIGSLSFVCKVIVPGRSFLSRLLGLAGTVQDLHHKVRLTKSA